MNSKIRLVLNFVFLSTLILPAPLHAQGRGQAKGKAPSESQTSVTVVFRDSDRATFHDYFLTHKIVAQPLPPGIAKNVARGKPLPPGIAKRALPTELLRVAPKVPDVSFAIVGEVVVAIRSGVVIDVLPGVFR